MEITADASVHHLVSRWWVCALPYDHEESPTWSVVVVRERGNVWSVRRNSRVLSRDDRFEPECGDDRMDERWLAEHRFGLEEALERASRAASRLRVNGMTALEYLEWEKSQNENGDSNGRGDHPGRPPERP